MAEYKDIVKGLYQISNAGIVKSVERKVKSPRGFRTVTERLMKPKHLSNGYLCIGLMINKVHKFYLIHRLVATAFIKNPQNYPVVNHKDCDKHNNNISNLEWCTHQHNHKHASENGLKPRGEKVHNAKLTNRQVLKIRELLKTKKTTFIADKYNVSPCIVSHIKYGRNYNLIR